MNTYCVQADLQTSLPQYISTHIFVIVTDIPDNYVHNYYIF